MNVKRKTKMQHLLYGTSNIIYSSVDLALLTEKGPSLTIMSMDMQIYLKAIQIYLSDCINVRQPRDRTIGPKQIYI